jgi:sulfur-oxidizing protein SoxY
LLSLLIYKITALFRLNLKCEQFCLNYEFKEKNGMSLPRRTFLKGLFATGGTMAVGTTLLPQNVMADLEDVTADLEDAEKKAAEKKAADEQEQLKNIFEKEFGTSEIEKSAQISIKAPEIAENGEVVPITVKTDLPELEFIALIAQKNSVPLVAQFHFPDPENAIGWVKTRIKMAETSNLVAVIKANGRLYEARREVSITIGGCGG